MNKEILIQSVKQECDNILNLLSNSKFSKSELKDKLAQPSIEFNKNKSLLSLNESEVENIKSEYKNIMSDFSSKLTKLFITQNFK